MKFNQFILNANSVHYYLLAVCLLTLNISCQQQLSPPPQEEENQNVRGASYGDGIHLNNPNYTEEMFFKASMIEGLILFSMADGRSLLGCNMLSGYETLIEEGSLPIIFANRYKGNDLISTAEFSPGDIFVDYDTDDSTFRFYLHNGELDAAYEPDAVSDGSKLPWAGGPGMYLTDGRSLFMEETVEPGVFMVDDPGGFRERFHIPPGDDARTTVFTVYYTINKIMYQAADILVGGVPGSLDGYIDLLGRKNPVAWINPYTGGDIEKVPWVKVPVHLETGPLGQYPIDLEEVNDGEYDSSDLAGNFSFILRPSPTVEGELRAYAQFYFMEPDGSVSAYLALGQGPQERYNSTTMWSEMVSASE